MYIRDYWPDGAEGGRKGDMTNYHSTTMVISYVPFPPCWRTRLSWATRFLRHNPEHRVARVMRERLPPNP